MSNEGRKGHLVGSGIVVAIYQKDPLFSPGIASLLSEVLNSTQLP